MIYSKDFDDVFQICPDELTLHLFMLTKKLKDAQTVFLNATFLSLCKCFDVMAFNGYLVEVKMLPLFQVECKM